MAARSEVGGMLYIGKAPPSEQIPEHDTEINDDQVVGNACVAGPITIGATITIIGNMVVI